MSLRTMKIFCAYEESKFLGIHLRFFSNLGPASLAYLDFYFILFIHFLKPLPRMPVTLFLRL